MILAHLHECNEAGCPVADNSLHHQRMLLIKSSPPEWLAAAAPDAMARKARAEERARLQFSSLCGPEHKTAL